MQSLSLAYASCVVDARASSSPGRSEVTCPASRPRPLAAAAALAVLLAGSPVPAASALPADPSLSTVAATADKVRSQHGRLTAAVHVRLPERVEEAIAEAQYRVEAFLTGSLVAQNAVLWGSFAAIVVIGGVAYRRATGFEPAKAYWRSWCALSGAEPDFSDDPWKAKVVVGALTVAQFLFFALLVGAIEAAITAKLAELNSGRTRVFESRHEVVLGWNSRLPDVLRHLATAGESNREKLRIVVLADRAKTDMDRLIRDALSRRRFPSVSIICRAGDPASPADQHRVAVHRANKIVVLADSSEGVAPAVADALAFKAALALKHSVALPSSDLGSGISHATQSAKGIALSSSSGMSPSGFRAVVESTDPAKDPLIALLGPSFTQLQWPDLASRHLVKTALQPTGLADVHRELLDFDGSELYLRRFPELEGFTVKDACNYMRSSVLVGVIRSATGRIVLNPAPRERVGAGDSVILLARDKLRFGLNKRRSVSVDPSRTKPHSASSSVADGASVSPPNVGRSIKSPSNRGVTTVAVRPPRKEILVLGWRPGMSSILCEIDGMVAPGSRVSVLAEASRAERLSALTHEGLGSSAFKNFRMNNIVGDPCDRRTVAKSSRMVDTVIVLLDHCSPAQDDRQRESRVLESLVAVRASFSGSPSQQPKIAAEVMSADTQRLATTENPDVDCVSLDDFSALLLAQAAYEPKILPVLRILLSQHGPEIGMRSGELYFRPGEEHATFGSLLERGRERRETLLGYVSSHDGVIVLNPDKTAVVARDRVRHFVAVVEDIHAVVSQRGHKGNHGS